jgi:hypothetical protein
MMAGKIEIRKSGEKFRFVVLNRSGEKLMQSAPFEDKAATKRAATALTRAVTGAEVVDATKPAAAAPKAK